jgi:hypothetical protein
MYARNDEHVGVVIPRREPRHSIKYREAHYGGAS